MRFILIFATVCTLSVCKENAPYQKMVHKGTTVEYNQGMALKDIENLVYYLDVQGLLKEGEEETIRVLKSTTREDSNDVVMVLFKVQPHSLTDQDVLDAYQVIRADLNLKVFNGQLLEIHFCDENFNTKKIIKQDIDREFELLNNQDR